MILRWSLDFNKNLNFDCEKFKFSGSSASFVKPIISFQPPQYGFSGQSAPGPAPRPGYGLPAYGASPPPPPPPGANVNVTVMPGPTVVVARNLGTRSSPANCPSCHAYVRSHS